MDDADAQCVWNLGRRRVGGLKSPGLERAIQHAHVLNITRKEADRVDNGRKREHAVGLDPPDRGFEPNDAAKRGGPVDVEPSENESLVCWKHTI